VATPVWISRLAYHPSKRLRLLAILLPLIEEIKDAIRRRTVDREKAKVGISFLGQPMGRALHAKLKTANESWKNSRDDTTLVAEVVTLSEQLGKQGPGDSLPKRLNRQDLDLLSFLSSDRL
jgi:hypothetical protein